MCSGDFEVHFGVARHTVAPVDDAVMARINRSLEHGGGDFASQGINKVASAASGVAVGQDILTVLLHDAQADGFSSMNDGVVGKSSANRRG